MRYKRSRKNRPKPSRVSRPARVSKGGAPRYSDPLLDTVLRVARRAVDEHARMNAYHPRTPAGYGTAGRTLGTIDPASQETQVRAPSKVSQKGVSRSRRRRGTSANPLRSWKGGDARETSGWCHCGQCPADPHWLDASYR